MLPMHHKAIPPTQDGTESEDVQRVVLALVLAEHPAQLTAEELAREVGAAVDHAIDDLSRTGLLRREGASILPTRAALHFDRLPS
jgi:hypothetical protein